MQGRRDRDELVDLAHAQWGSAALCAQAGRVSRESLARLGTVRCPPLHSSGPGKNSLDATSGLTVGVGRF